MVKFSVYLNRIVFVMKLPAIVLAARSKAAPLLPFFFVCRPILVISILPPCGGRKRLPVLHHSEVIYFISCGLIEPILGLLKIKCHLNRKESNNQESKQLHDTLSPKHQRDKRTHLKQRHHKQNTTSRKPKGQFLSKKIDQTAIQNKNFTRTYLRRLTMTELVNRSRSTAGARGSIQARKLYRRI